VIAPLLDQLDGRFCVLFGRSGLPGFSGEPRGLGRESLGLEKVGAESALLRAGELEMMGELMDEFAAQSCRRARYAHRQRPSVRPVLGSGGELPGGLEGYGRNAIQSRRMGVEEVAPGFLGQGLQIGGDALSVKQVGTRIRAKQKDRSGAKRSDEDGKCDCATHRVRIMNG